MKPKNHKVMTDAQILVQLLYGYHLEPEELERANHLVRSLQLELEEKNAKRQSKKQKLC